MTENDLDVQGSLIAIRFALSAVLAKVADDRDDAGLINTLHGVLASMVDKAMDRTRAVGEDSATVDRLHAAAIRELDLIFGASHSLMRGRPTGGA